MSIIISKLYYYRALFKDQELETLNTVLITSSISNLPDPVKASVSVSSSLLNKSVDSSSIFALFIKNKEISPSMSALNHIISTAQQKFH